MEWQPIETAPKDGTAFLAIEAFSRVDEEDNLHPGDCEVVKWSKTADGWIAFGVKLGSFEPTHWMPLPPPPDTPSQDGRVQSSKTSTELDAALKFLLSKT